MIPGPPQTLFRRIFGVAVFGIASAVVAACAMERIDLGQNVTAASPATQDTKDAGLVPSKYGCDEWIDDELFELRDGSCGGTCTSEGADPYPLDSKKEFIAASAGQWFWCNENHIGPYGAVGLEFAPGCRIFFLYQTEEGHIVRGIDPEYQATYDIHDPKRPYQRRQIDIHFEDKTDVTFDVAITRCPERATLVKQDSTMIELSADIPQHERPIGTR